MPRPVTRAQSKRSVASLAGWAAPWGVSGGSQWPFGAISAPAITARAGDGSDRNLVRTYSVPSPGLNT